MSYDGVIVERRDSLQNDGVFMCVLRVDSVRRELTVVLLRQKYASLWALALVETNEHWSSTISYVRCSLSAPILSCASCIAESNCHRACSRLGPLIPPSQGTDRMCNKYMGIKKR